MPQQTFEELADILRPLLEDNQYFAVCLQPLRDRDDELYTSAVLYRERESVLPTISHSQLTHSVI